MQFLSMAIADLIAIAALCTIYLIRHNRRELVVSYTIINVGVFVVTEALSFASGTSAGMGLGLFGVLSIIRLRSTALAQREVAYYFVALALGLIAGVGLQPEAVAYGLMAMLVVIMALVDMPFFGNKQKTQAVTVDRAMSDTNELKEYLNTRLAYEVLSVKIIELDMVNDTTRVEVSYSTTAEPETKDDNTPAPTKDNGTPVPEQSAPVPARQYANALQNYASIPQK